MHANWEDERIKMINSMHANREDELINRINSMEPKAAERMIREACSSMNVEQEIMSQRMVLINMSNKLDRLYAMVHKIAENIPVAPNTLPSRSDDSYDNIYDDDKDDEGEEYE